MTGTGAPRGRGRPPGGGSTSREAVLRAASAAFARHGYDRATLRGIAKDAEVDPGMVRHWFGDKEGLFQASLRLPFNPAEAVPPLLAGDLADLGARIVRMFVTAWESAEGGAFTALLRGAAGHDASADKLRELIVRGVLVPLTERLGAADGMLRATLAGSQLVGLGMIRYVLRAEPLASLPVERLVELYGPTLQRYLTGEL